MQLRKRNATLTCPRILAFSLILSQIGQEANVKGRVTTFDTPPFSFAGDKQLTFSGTAPYIVREFQLMSRICSVSFFLHPSARCSQPFTKSAKVSLRLADDTILHVMKSREIILLITLMSRNRKIFPDFASGMSKNNVPNEVKAAAVRVPRCSCGWGGAENWACTRSAWPWHIIGVVGHTGGVRFAVRAEKNLQTGVSGSNACHCH